MTTSTIHSHTNTPFTHWMLWVGPSHKQMTELKGWDEKLKSRILILHPRKKDLLLGAIEIAIKSGNYAMITINEHWLYEKTRWKITHLCKSNNIELIINKSIANDDYSNSSVAQAGAQHNLQLQLTF